MTNQLALGNQQSGVKHLATADILINAVLFQISWFTAVLAGGYWALLPVAAMLAHYVKCMRYTRLLLLFGLAALGILIDSVFLELDVYQFAESPQLPWLKLPVWLACLWLAFCLSLPVSLAWLVRRPSYFVLGCTVFGPLSYLAGRQWQVVEFADHELVFLAIEWCVFSFVSCFNLQSSLSVSSSPAPTTMPWRK